MCQVGTLRKSEELCVHVSEPGQGGQERKYLSYCISNKFGARSGEEGKRKYIYSKRHDHISPLILEISCVTNLED